MIDLGEGQLGVLRHLIIKSRVSSLYVCRVKGGESQMEFRGDLKTHSKQHIFLYCIQTFPSQSGWGQVVRETHKSGGGQRNPQYV